ncbi:hypothetical protein WR25_04678 [Diploscapter pachys]|uniref:Uncharacterized protein n=1 Tax=Diploscapter pachys TaxID=2018661 RepID=A0A2A2KEP0_9BILA|nr:hypothetical protein WR25_04678 [Diploscapter pachys]
MFSASVRQFTECVCLPAAFEVVVSLLNRSDLPRDTGFKFCLKIRELDETVLTLHQEPVFSTHYDSRDDAIRFVCPRRGATFDPTLPPSPSKRQIVLTHEATLNREIMKFTMKQQFKSPGIFVFESAWLEIDGQTRKISEIDHRKPFFVIVQKRPSRIMIEERDLLAGVDEKVMLTIEPATDVESSSLKMTSSDASLIFHDSSSNLVPELTVSVPALQKDSNYSFHVSLFLPLSAEFIRETVSVKRKICVQWEEKPYYVEVSFIPLFTMQRRITALESKSLIVFELGRPPIVSSTVCFDSAHLEAKVPDPEKPSALAKMLNPDISDLEPASISTIVWVLPVDGPAVRHKMKLKYRVKKKIDGLLIDEDKEYYKYEEERDLNVCKVSYEMCAQILSQQPGAQLCRAGAPCDFVVSVRSLSHTVEMLYVVLDADEKLWILTERAKVLSLKESGLGQIVFSIVPCIAGFLPYPSISIYSCIGTGENEDYLPGSPLISYHRTEGKQIRVLAPNADSNAFQEKSGSIRGKFKKLTKIFD